MNITFQDIVDFNDNVTQDYYGQKVIVVRGTYRLRKLLDLYIFYYKNALKYAPCNAPIYFLWETTAAWCQKNSFVETNGCRIDNCIFECKECGATYKYIKTINSLMQYCPKCLR